MGGCGSTRGKSSREILSIIGHAELAVERKKVGLGTNGLENTTPRCLGMRIFLKIARQKAGRLATKQ